ncbi:MAG TPA: hypothetical protein VIX90_07485 [Edaphobacter sp.]
MVDELDPIKQQLESFASNSEKAIVTVSADEECGHLIGNRVGFIRLAIVSLDAAQGKRVNFENHKWLKSGDWLLEGFSYDEAGGEISSASTFRDKMNTAIMFIIVALIAGIFVLGLESAYQHIHRWVN